MTEIPPSSKPTYGSATRMAQIVHWLHQAPMGLSFRDLRERLRVSERTLTRYLTTLRETLVDHDGEPLIELQRTGQGSRLRFRRKRFKMEGTAYELMSLYLALDLMNFLDGTMFRQGTQEVLERLQEALLRGHGHQTNLVLKDFNKKFYHWTEAPKDYSAHNTILEQLVKALILQHNISMRYQVPGKPEKSHTLSPLSLLMFKRALYLVGRKGGEDGETPTRDLTFAVERIQAITVLEEGFSYPPEYEPQKRFQSSFGLVAEAKPEWVVLSFDPLVAANVESRRWHPSQKMSREPNGRLILEMNTEIGVELMSWILSYGAFVEVREPKQLVDQIVERLQRALQVYKRVND